MSYQNIFGPPPVLGSTNDNVELLKAWAGTSLAYAVALLGGQVFNSRFWTALIVAGATAGVGILLHELAHRIVARGYGARAHFVANNAWLVLSVVVAFGGFFIAAPGAVWHTGTRTIQQGGIIALAGPATNIALALLFVLASYLVPPLGILALVCSVGYNINAFLAFFNMLPFGPFDGKKVFDWNKIIWGVVTALSFVMTFVLPRYFNLFG